MGHDSGAGKFAQHGGPTQGGLGYHQAEGHGRRNQDPPFPPVAHPGCDEQEQDQWANNERRGHPVGILDEGFSFKWGKDASIAARPVGAAEARFGDTDNSTQDHQSECGENRECRDAPEPVVKPAVVA